MEFRARLLATLRAIEPVLRVPGVLVVGSEVPNLLEPNAASTLVVSQDVDIGVPVLAHEAVKRALREVRNLAPSPAEPSVWLSEDPALIEVNFLGMDATKVDPADTYVLEDATLPLLVFGPLSLARAAEPVEIDGLRIPLPRVAGLLLEKLITDRTAEKGDRDLLVALALMLLARPADLQELEREFATLTNELRHAVLSNLTVLSLLAVRRGMPDPRPHRKLVADLLAKLEALPLGDEP